MAARAIWKGVLTLGDERVPLKIYAGVEDRGIHFRLLHEKDRVPVKQRMVNPETGDEVAYGDTLRGFETVELREYRERRDEGASLEEALAASLRAAGARRSA